MSSTFEATARRNGNSLAITIPKQVAKGLEIKHGTDLKVIIQLMDDKKETE